MQLQPRTLAIDYGEQRCGLAWTDPLGLIATALSPCTRAELDARVAAHVAEGPVGRIVLGYPTRLDGSPTHVTQAVLRYADALRQRYPALQVVLQDERLSSTEAADALRQGGASRKKRADKHLINSVAAVLILQRYLEAPNGHRSV